MEGKPPIQPLLSEDRVRIKAQLMSFACSEAWAESILESLDKPDPRGKRRVRLRFDARGRLKTKMPQLLELIATAMIYPPAADDVASSDGSHAGSTMRPCFCDQCTKTNRTGGARHVHWPASYMVKDHLSFTCSVNKAELNADELESFDPSAELLCETRRGRVVMPGEMSRATRLDADAWRADKIDRLPWIKTFYPWYCSPDHPEQETYLADIIAAFTGRLHRHRWSQVTGEASEDSLGRRISNVRKQLRGLNNIGSISDFIELGHRLTATGLSDDVAAKIESMVAEYPREPRTRQAGFLWQKTRLGKARNG